ncbi:hypothetical protein I3842_07G057900 [Carya illinoinensis]|uniref:Transmembrane protein n=1 Tax=Carya illinoinensis TaxID=32201 RepID=A0A922JG00_CARIL|nr:hypothetical protein I3842_07G057900 [Carya illinoinensis]
MRFPSLKTPNRSRKNSFSQFVYGLDPRAVVFIPGYVFLSLFLLFCLLILPFFSFCALAIRVYFI